ncbi:MAG: TM2 domain-containing protein [Treponema sp.]|nr:TM2 domain-containing protein [Treponema sp.]
MFCTKCGKEVTEGAAFCQFCGEKIEQLKGQETLSVGTQTQTSAPESEEISKKSRLAAVLLGIFVGSLGIHNFYLKRYGRAIAQLSLCIIAWVIYIAGFLRTVLTISNTYVNNPAASERAAFLLMGTVFPFIILVMAVAIWALVEWIIIAAGTAKDGDGLLVKNW